MITWWPYNDITLDKMKWSCVTNKKIIKMDDKMIGLSLNSKHKTKQPKQKHKSVQDQSTKKLLLWYNKKTYLHQQNKK